MIDDLYVEAYLQGCDNKPFSGCLKTGKTRIRRYANMTETMEVVGYNNGHEVWAIKSQRYENNSAANIDPIRYEDTRQYMEILKKQANL